MFLSATKWEEKLCCFFRLFLTRKKERVWQIIPSNKIWSLINLLAQQFFSKIKTTNKNKTKKVNLKRWKRTAFKYTYAIMLKFYFFGKFLNVYIHALRFIYFMLLWCLLLLFPLWVLFQIARRCETFYVFDLQHKQKLNEQLGII